MQLRKTVMMLTALSALSVVMTGCPGEEEGALTCSLDADCIEGEICHPSAKVCVTTCTAGADCPDSAKTCDVISSTDSRKVCRCTTDQLCAQEGTDLVCSTLDKVCTSKCTATSCGSGRTCDTATGQCTVSGPKTCTPACTGNQVCDTNTGTCVNNGAACTGEGQSTCIYGTQFCSSSTCQALPAPTCDNYTNFTAKGDLGTTGAIIYSAAVEGAAIDTNWCGTTSSTPKRVKIALKAYSSSAFPASKDGLNQFLYVRVAGTTQSAVPLISASSGNYTVSGTNSERAEIILSLCVADNSTTTSTGFYFANGNFFCFQANYQ